MTADMQTQVDVFKKMLSDLKIKTGDMSKERKKGIMKAIELLDEAIEENLPLVMVTEKNKRQNLLLSEMGGLSLCNLAWNIIEMDEAIKRAIVLKIAEEVLNEIE